MAAADRSIRASDADRERIAAALRDHYAAGRLTGDEFNERLDQAYAAKTLGDLNDLTTDLPMSDLSQPPQPTPSHFPRPVQPAGPIVAGSGRFSPAWRTAWGSWLSISLVCFVVWLVSGANANPWFLWPTGVLGAGLLAPWILGAPAPGHRRAIRQQYRLEYRMRRRGY